MKPYSPLILALLASPGAADTLFVAQDGSEEYTTISDAIAGASSGDTITIYAGTYAETIDPGGLDLTIQAYSGDDVIIDGEATRRCVECDSGETSAMTFSELTFENGYGNDGGGARLYESSPVFSHCTFRNCSVYDDGGGVWCNNSTASFTSCTFKDCESLDDGGGLWGWESGVSLTDCSFEDCRADGSGGAVYGWGTLGESDLAVEGCLFDGNVAAWSAGTLYWSGGEQSFSNCQFYSGLSEDYHCGGIQVMWAESEVNISNCEFVDNSGGSTGEESVGAMSISNCDAMISNCIYDSNVADNPAATYLHSGTFVITECSFSDNSGGAVLMGEGELEVIDSTFTGNTGDHDGGAIRIRGHTNWVSPTVSISGCEFEDNAGRYGGAIYVYGIDEDYCTIGIEDCNFSNNIAEDGGGAIKLKDGDATITGGTWIGNSVLSGSGGAISTTSGTFLLSSAWLSGNDTDTGTGTALYLGNNVEATLTNVIACDHLGTEIYDAAGYSNGGGNDLGNWCCLGDITEDGTVDGGDLLDFIDDWALSSDGDNRSDCDRDEDVDVVDLIGMLSNWGECEY